MKKLTYCAFALTCVCTVLPATAADRFWNATPGGNWHDAFNWDPNSVPTSSDAAWIENGGEAGISSAAVADELYVNNGGLLISNEATLTNRRTLIGIDAGTTASVQVRFNATLNTSQAAFANDFFLGFHGHGSLTVRDGGSVIVRNGQGPILAGRFVGSVGNINIGSVQGGSPLGTGIINASEINGGDGSSTLFFNHTNPAYYLTKDGTSAAAAVALTGDLRVAHAAGHTTLTGVNTYTGGTEISGGTLRAGGPGALPTNTRYIVDGGTLDLNGVGLTMSRLSGNGGTVAGISNILFINQTSGAVSFGGALLGDGPVFKLGNGSLTLTGHSAYGETNVQGGTLAVDGGSINNTVFSMTVGDQVGSNATLNVMNGGSVTSGFGQVGAAGSTGRVTIFGNGSMWTNSSYLRVGFDGDGMLTVRDGGMVHAGGAFSLAQQAGSIGTLNIGNGGGAGIVSTASINGGLGTATLNFNHTDSDYFFTSDGTAGGTAVAISGSTRVNHLGTGMTTLLGNHTYTGPTTVDAGTLVVDGAITNSAITVNAGGTLGGTGTAAGPVTVASGGTVSPGASAGTLTVGSLDLQSGGDVRIEIGGTVPGSEHDVVAVSGSATLAGTLSIHLIDGFVPLPGTSYEVLQYGSVNGDVAISNQTGFAGLSFDKTFGENSLTLTASAIGGDANLDGMVTIADLGILAANWQASDVTWLQADFTGDGSVTIADLGILAANWQAGVGGSSMSFAEALATFDAFDGVAVPEPVSGLMAVAGMGMIVVRRRRVCFTGRVPRNASGDRTGGRTAGSGCRSGPK